MGVCIMTDEDILKAEEIYEEYCKRHPEEITSDFMLFEDGNEDYIKEIIKDLYVSDKE